MKAVVALLCVLAAVAVADIIVDVGTERSLFPNQWTSSKEAKITVKTTKYLANVEVRIVRRLYFAYNDSEVWLCPWPSRQCSNDKNNPYIAQNITMSSIFSSDLYLQYVGDHFNEDMSEITIKACENHCPEECPGDCNGRGGCSSAFGVCVCDDGRHNLGKDCVSSGMDWFVLFFIIGAAIVLFFIILVVVIICICCCCCCACCCCKD